MANDAHEEFWGCTLSGSKTEYLWDPETGSEVDVEHKLQLNTACLGHTAKNNERNVVEVTTQDDDGQKITCPVVSLRVGGTECIHIDLGFYNTTKFVLKEGSGPVSLCGVHLKALPLDFDENEDTSEDEEVPDLVQAPKAKNGEKAEIKKVEEKKDADKPNKQKNEPKQVKRPLPDKADELPSKKKKPAEEDSEEDSDEDDTDDEEMPSLLDNEAEEAESDEDSEDGDDEPEDGDEVDSDEEDEDESGEDEEETIAKPNKKQPNGNAAKATPGKGVPQKDNKQKGKDKPASEDKTPAKKAPGKKENVQTPKSQAKKTPEELKAFLLKSPNLPKTFDKFSNYMKNNMKVTDEKSQKEFWDYVQKNKK